MEREALKLALEAQSYAAACLLNQLSTKDKRAYAMEKLSASIAAIEKALAQPAQEPDMLTIAYQSGYHDGKKAALAGREWNFCERCGKRTADKTTIHTCTPPQEGK
jgi:hypothetical protein